MFLCRVSVCPSLKVRLFFWLLSLLLLLLLLLLVVALVVVVVVLFSLSLAPLSLSPSFSFPFPCPLSSSSSSSLPLFPFKDCNSSFLVPLPTPSPPHRTCSMNMRSNNLCILLEKLDGEFKDQLSGSIDLEEAKLVAEVVGKINGKWYGKADAPAIAFANRIDSNVYKIFGPTADGALKKVDRYKQGGAGWTYVIPRDFVGMWPEIKPEFFNILRFLGMTKNVGLTHGDSRSDNFFFYNDAAGVKRCGVLDFQLLLVADVSTDFVYFVGTSMAPEFQKENLEVLVDAYFDALHAGGGPKIEKGSDERAEFEECFDLSVVFMLTKLIVGAGGIDPAVPNAIDLMDLMLKRMIALYEMRNASAAFLKWREGTMLCQKAAGSQCSLDKLGMSPKTIALVNAPVNPIPVW